ncbi:MAG: MOSC domain-containing protein [Planctomycetaceae bacterium]|nr:MOSC domain-containing protein [Planctomycetaceae bacterium]
MIQEHDAFELEGVLPQVGSVKWIGVAAERRASINSLQEVLARVGTGLDGDHHSSRKPGGKRQVTLIQWEHLPVVASVLGRSEVRPEELRRNIVVSGINLLALKGKRFQVGECVLEYTGPCVPCSLMEENLGPGGFNAMRGHGGITAQVVSEGLIRIGDSVAVANC